MYLTSRTGAPTPGWTLFNQQYLAGAPTIEVHGYQQSKNVWIVNKQTQSKTLYPIICQLISNQHVGAQLALKK